MQVMQVEGEEVGLQHRKGKSDEQIIREALHKAWIGILEKYAQPGVWIPRSEEIRRELLNVGVKAGVDALVHEHWFLARWMVESEVRESIEKELNQLDIDALICEVREAQQNPAILCHLHENIRSMVLQR